MVYAYLLNGMCISPIRIKNPNKGLKVAPGSVNQLKDCTSAYIDVPCGVCSECIAVKQMSIVQRIQMESLDHHLFFCTLTYQDSEIPVIHTSTGYDIRYADVSDVQKMCKRLRKSEAFGRPFRYFAVSELGSKKGRPHFHIIFLLPKHEGDDFNTCISLQKRLFDTVFSEWRRNYGSTRAPIWRPLSLFVERFSGGELKRTFDLHYVQPYQGSSSFLSVAFYVIKYMLKPSSRAVRLQQALHLNLPPGEYEKVWSLVRPRYFKSLDFGSSKSQKVSDFLSECVSRSLEESSPYPCFYNVDTGQSFPLSRFYRGKSHIYDLDSALKFRELSLHSGLDSSDPKKVRHISELDKSISDYEKKVSSAFSHGSLDDVLDF